MDYADCSQCKVHNCKSLAASFPKNCPTREIGLETFDERAEAYLADEFTHEVAAAVIELQARFGISLCRAEEIAAFAQIMGYKRIGIAACVSVADPAQEFARMLRGKGFEDVPVFICKMGAVDKTRLGTPESHKLHPFGQDSICNPIEQARMLNERGTDLNVTVGLCAGHDILFQQYSEAPVTCLLTKDHPLDHNPIAAFDKDGEMYARIFEPGFPTERDID